MGKTIGVFVGQLTTHGNHARQGWTGPSERRTQKE